MKNKIINYVIYSACFFFFHFIEIKCQVFFLSTPFFFVLAYANKNLLILAPIYIISGVTLDLRWIKLLYLAVPVVIALLTLFIHYKIKKGPIPILTALYSALSYVPQVVLESTSLFKIITGVSGAVMSMPVFFILASVVRLIWKKRFNYPLATFEKISLLFVLALVGFGSGYLNIYFFSIYDFISLLAMLTLPFLGILGAIPIGVAFALGALIHSPTAFVLTITYAVFISIFPKEYGYFGGVLAVVLKAVLTLGNLLESSYFSLIPIGLATLITIVVPTKIKGKIFEKFHRENGVVTRALINKNRAEIREKMLDLSQSFFEVGKSLKSEEERELNQLELAKEVVERVCKRCSHYQACKKCLGGNDTEIVIQELMGSAIEMGKVSILDASPFLSSRCLRLNGLIVSANEVLIAKKEGRKQDGEREKNKSLLREQVEGIGSILGDLALSGTLAPISYEPRKEKRLKEVFNEEGISLNEVVVYSGERLSLSLLEGDERKSKVRELISQIMGTQMWASEIRKSVNGRVDTFWERAPKYKVAYGERVLSASRSGSGDREAVIRLNSHKVMLCLSDGMGHGKEAEENSTCALSLIKSLYKAGFDHLTVLKSVAVLLKVRGKEEFNAVDIAVIDTDTGEVDVIKQGAREGYVITPDGLQEISCGSLPLGIVEDVYPITESRTLTTNDFIVLLSDGVIDGLGKEKLEEILLSLSTRNPDDVCTAVMENVERLTGEDRDDCSIICARLF